MPGHALGRSGAPPSTARRRAPAAGSGPDALRRCRFRRHRAPACTTSKCGVAARASQHRIAEAIRRCSAAPASDSPQLPQRSGRRTASSPTRQANTVMPATRNPPTSPGASSARSGTGCQAVGPCPLACTRFSSDSAGISAGRRLWFLRQRLRSTRSPARRPAPRPRPPVPGSPPMTGSSCSCPRTADAPPAVGPSTTSSRCTSPPCDPR